MSPEVLTKFQEILKGNIKYTSGNLGLNMLISRLQRRVTTDPKTMESCLKEVDEFAARFANVMGDDFDKIAKL